MSKTRGIVLGAGHVNKIGPAGGSGGEGFGGGNPPSYNGKTVNPNFAEPGITSGPQGPGTPATSQRGNPDEASRVAFQGRYGVSPGAGGVDMNDPKANGSGVVFDGGTRANGMMPNPGASVDSPVSDKAPYFDTRTVAQENRAHLGQGNAAAENDLMKIPGGVMSRGMTGTSHPGKPENELTQDDTLPAVGARR